VLPIDSLIVI